MAVRKAHLGIWDAALRERVRELKGHQRPITDVAVTSDGALIVSAASDFLKIWDTSSGRCIQTLEVGNIAWTSVAISPDGSHVAATRDGRVQVWLRKRGPAPAPPIEEDKGLYDGRSAEFPESSDACEKRATTRVSPQNKD